MIRFGVLLLPVAIIMFILSILFILNPLVIISMFMGILSIVLIFIGVLRDRIEEKRRENQDDLSKY